MASQAILTKVQRTDSYSFQSITKKFRKKEESQIPFTRPVLPEFQDQGKTQHGKKIIGQYL